MSDNKIVRLEELIAHQTQQIDDLSGEIAKQWKTIDRLTRHLNQLSEHFANLENQSDAPPIITKPPHY